MVIVNLCGIQLLAMYAAACAFGLLDTQLRWYLQGRTIFDDY